MGVAVVLFAALLGLVKAAARLANAAEGGALLLAVAVLVVGRAKVEEGSKVDEAF